MTGSTTWKNPPWSQWVTRPGATSHVVCALQTALGSQMECWPLASVNGPGRTKESICHDARRDPSRPPSNKLGPQSDCSHAPRIVSNMFATSRGPLLKTLGASIFAHPESFAFFFAAHLFTPVTVCPELSMRATAGYARFQAEQRRRHLITG